MKIGPARANGPRVLTGPGWVTFTPSRPYAGDASAPGAALAVYPRGRDREGYPVSKCM